MMPAHSPSTSRQFLAELALILAGIAAIGAILLLGVLDRAGRETLIGLEVVGVGSVITLVAVTLRLVREVAQRRHAEGALRENEARFQMFMDNSPAAAFMKDAEGRYVFLNRAFERVLGKPAEALLGRTDYELWPEATAQQLRHNDKTVLDAGRPQELFEIVSMPDGRPLYLLVYKFPFTDSARRTFLGGVSIDITSRKMAEEALRRSEEHLRQARMLEALGRMAAGTAHDFNTILTLIVGYCDRLDATVAQDPAGRDTMSGIKQAVDRGTALTRQLLSIGRQQASRPRAIRLGEVVNGMDTMLRRLVGDAVRLDLEVSPELPDVQADPLQIEQILMNLADNARDAMPGGGQLSIRVGVSQLDESLAAYPDTVESGRYALLSVRDTGTGIDDESLAHIFEPFYTTKAPGRGTGLGLATIYGIVRQHKGFLQVESGRNQGTCFTIYLPAGATPTGEAATSDLPAAGAEREASAPVPRPPAEAPARATGGEAPGGTGDPQPLTLLLVEDEADVRHLVREALHPLVDHVEEAGDGESALSACARRLPDVIVTDLRMPRLDGLALIDRVLARAPHLPVIMLTNVDDAAMAVEAMKHGVTDYLVKPIDRAVLVERVRAVIDSRVRPRRALSAAGGIATGSGQPLIAVSPRMQPILETIAMIRGNRSSVLVQGESGTGKEVIARAIHFDPANPRRPFVAVNCGGIPEGLLESQLFGHVRGAFTGAIADAPGLFRTASGGTLFLDEIAEMPAHLQVKLLRAVQEGEVLPVGGSSPVRIDVRLIAATHRQLDKALAEGRLRQDLFYRLAVVPILIPPLRERPEDIPVLASHFSARFARTQQKTEKTFAPASLACMTSYAWPGNVRELQNLIERVYSTVHEVRVEPRHILSQFGIPGTATGSTDVIPTLEELERRHIERVLDITGGKKGDAARILGVERHRLQRMIARHGLMERGESTADGT